MQLSEFFCMETPGNSSFVIWEQKELICAKSFDKNNQLETIDPKINMHWDEELVTRSDFYFLDRFLLKKN
jgi:hypothetical protein